MTATLKLLPIEDYGTKGRSITLTEERLKELWESGALNNMGYMALILAFLDPDKPIYPDVVCVDWRGTTDDKGKAKELKPMQVRRMLLALEEKEIIGVQQQPVQLSFSLWNDGYQDAE